MTVKMLSCFKAASRDSYTLRKIKSNNWCRAGAKEECYGKKNHLYVRIPHRGAAMRNAPSYGVRGRRNFTNTGVRVTASTFGKARIGTYAEKANGHITVESAAERLVAHLLCIDPRVRSFKPQPFTVDLVERRLLYSRTEITEARKMRQALRGHIEYTPDFATVQIDGLQCAYEVKTEGYEGDTIYQDKIDCAREIIEAHGISLCTAVVPEDERHPLLVNIQLLKPALTRAHEYLTTDLIDQVERYCASGPVLQRNLCADIQISPGMIPPLLVIGVLQADLVRHRIQGSLELSPAFGDLSHLCLIEELLS
ncbi:hypothetical protein [Undibacterium luofuense]|nr:hypothetical protein [Undibacterium luofuense]